ncbi:O-methyltransferase [Blastopirellula marina]|uniref:Methyltransferase n=1 Tax=Blastopirellula marina TaxID=124 RepID=A0A2S8F7K2_9BACT|nr:class I SAM-dependent methyltransferase [Blastopirellula marina]PQO28141.1 methyltransferase [Blastopirellula marina]PTL41681.1 methyltransferase [Blastopirellula marina]
MNSLLTPPLAAVLERLFEAADASLSSPVLADFSEEDRLLMNSKTHYAEFYSRMREIPLAVSRETGTLLYMLARGRKAHTIIEFGTSFGISTIFLAAALRDNGGGRLITTEFESSKVRKAQIHLTEAGLSDLVEFREGDALTTLSDNLPASIDLVLLDGAKQLYLDVLRLLEDRLTPGALIIADNADHCPEYVQHVRSSRHGYVSIPFRDDVEVSARVA